jgi:SpoVK/Ycf46/Vps4 family AAA+-type ATPase
MSTDPLRHLFQAQNHAVRLVTNEEPEAFEHISNIAADLRLQCWVWSAVDGLRRVDTAQEPQPDTTNAGAALKYLSMNLTEPALCTFLDLADHLDDKIILRCVREFIELIRQWSVGSGNSRGNLSGTRFVMIDHREQVPPILNALTARHFVPQPDDAEIESIVKRTIRRMNREKPVNVGEMKRTDVDMLVVHLRGLSRRQVAQVVSDVVAEDFHLSPSDLKKIARAKRTLLQSHGVLEPVDAPTTMDTIGGLKNLKEWLAKRTRSFEPGAKEFGLKPPRGILLLGVQGAGKSLAAKAIATAWTRPLMRLDPGALYDKYIGESESRLRDALRQAESMSPVVLWIDEIEKGFASAAGQSSDGGLSRRMFGSLLTWMQEHTHPVFLVATANDIEALPPELLRKGRFDEIFFVDLPTLEARQEIFAIHLKRRKQDVQKFSVAHLAAESEGFSGAEIEQAILAGLHEAYAENRPLIQNDIMKAIQTSPPLSVTAREKIEALRAWSKGRCVPAD